MQTEAKQTKTVDLRLMPNGVAITGWGASVPDRVIPNTYFESFLETNDEWIQDRTGIQERRWIEGVVSASELAESACRDAIAKAGLQPSDIDGIVVATVTPDCIFPSTACRIQERLKISGGFAYDINAACSGFVYAVSQAAVAVSAGAASHVLVVGVDIFSPMLNKQDRGTCILFGDGAGAIVLSAVSKNEKNVLAGFTLESNGQLGNLLGVPSGTAYPVSPESLQNGEHFFFMNGREVFKYAVRAFSEVISQTLEKLHLTKSNVQFYFTHQANKRILQSVAEQLEEGIEKFPVNLNRYGNTSAASIPILFSECLNRGEMKSGDCGVFSAFGGGLTWGAIVFSIK
jgi:3-oxoacyl-[acyl-carrier-protein] synthase III